MDIIGGDNNNKNQAQGEPDLLDFDLIGGGGGSPTKPAQAQPAPKPKPQLKKPEKKKMGLMAPPGKGAGGSNTKVAQSNTNNNNNDFDLMGLGLGGDAGNTGGQTQAQPTTSANDGLLDLLGGTTTTNAPNQGNTQANTAGGILGGPIISTQTTFKNPPLSLVIPRGQKGMAGRTGVEITAGIHVVNQGYCLKLLIKNYTMQDFTLGNVMVGNNSFGLNANAVVNQTVPMNGFREITVPLQRGTPMQMGMLN